MKKVLAIFICTGAIVGCQTEPTKIYRSDRPDFQAQLDSLSRPIQITAETRLVDARSVLDTGLSKVRGSVPLRWEDFTQTTIRGKGSLQNDLDNIARRLALKGLNPEIPVVVFGDGVEGQGDEGRIAWMLMYLGFKDVQTVKVDALKVGRSRGDEPPVQNEKYWSPNIRISLVAEAKEVMGHALGKKPRTIHLIDVRSPKEYFARDKKTENYLDPDLRAVNIFWKEFFTKEGRPNLAIRNQLESVGIKKSDRIVVLSEQGLRSGAVTYALTMMGFTNVGNFSAGWKSLKP